MLTTSLPEANFKGYGEEDTAVSDSHSYQTTAYYKIPKGFSPGWLGIQKVEYLQDKVMSVHFWRSKC